MYKLCIIRSNTSQSQYFLYFVATCKDSNNSLRRWSSEKPTKEQPQELRICTNDTRGMESMHFNKRPLRSTKREAVANELVTDIPSNWRRKKATTNMEFCDFSPPNLYRNEVLHKAKQKHKKQLLGITIKSPILSLIELKHSQFSGSIHSIVIDPILVHY